MNKHKWHDVIVAYAEGREVQFKNPDTRWMRADCLIGINNERLEWRVKPVKKEMWLNIYDGYVYDHDSREQADSIKAPASGKRRIACIRIEYEEGEGL